MPIYKLQCKECDSVFEKLVFNLTAPIQCPSCGESEVEKLPTTAAFKLKGAGFHRNDYPNIDQKVGADAEGRWKNIHERREKKDKLRKNLAADETIVREDGGDYVVEKRDKVPVSTKDLHDQFST